MRLTPDAYNKTEVGRAIIVKRLLEFTKQVFERVHQPRHTQSIKGQSYTLLFSMQHVVC